MVHITTYWECTGRGKGSPWASRRMASPSKHQPRYITSSGQYPVQGFHSGYHRSMFAMEPISWRQDVGSNPERAFRIRSDIYTSARACEVMKVGGIRVELRLFKWNFVGCWFFVRFMVLFSADKYFTEKRWRDSWRMKTVIMMAKRRPTVSLAN